MEIFKNEKSQKYFPKAKEVVKDSQKQKLMLSIYIHLTEFIYSSAP